MVIVHEVFQGIQGEGSLAGFPFTFIRLAGCNLHCEYCDTPEARDPAGTEESVIELADRVAGMGLSRVMVTGGEPLLQKDGRVLIDALVERGLDVTVETNGSIELEGVNPRARIIMDVKTPGSGQEPATNIMNLMWLKPTDEVKFVLTSRRDYAWARDFCRTRGLFETGRTIHFSPAHGLLPATELAEWILADKLNARVHIQLHKLLWPGGEPKVK
jgi:7-carboxy-7-deazaguanine synthase